MRVQGKHPEVLIRVIIIKKIMNTYETSAKCHTNCFAAGPPYLTEELCLDECVSDRTDSMFSLSIH